MSVDNLLAEDLDRILADTVGIWEEMRGQRLFVTGGTGFIGRWLLESFVWANDRLKLGAEVVVLSRDPSAFARKAPHLAEHPRLSWITGDVRDFAFPAGKFSYVIHAATDASAKLNAEAPLAMFDTIVQGIRRTLDFASQAGVRKFLFTSSGAVYGRQPPELTHVPEDYTGGPDPTDPKSAYGEGKRAAELLGCLYFRQCGLEFKIARCFAFVGPILPLDSHFAVGNFIRDALDGGPIRVQGDGTPHRSYLYAADLATWLWTILFLGKTCRAYNVGSATDVTIAELARRVAQGTDCPPTDVHVSQTPLEGRNCERYVPDIHRAAQELGLRPLISLDDSIRWTYKWYAGSTRHARTDLDRNNTT